MPLIRIQTNVVASSEQSSGFLTQATEITARGLGKPASVMMATLDAGKAMTFGGSSEPTALFEIEGIELSPEPTDALCQQLSDLAEKELQVPGNRVFVKLTNVPRGYWAGNRKVY
jgi:phenylpyruvate tautomerase PptA (4-oxalocrotonate tautomerase family)